MSGRKIYREFEEMKATMRQMRDDFSGLRKDWFSRKKTEAEIKSLETQFIARFNGIDNRLMKLEGRN